MFIKIKNVYNWFKNLILKIFKRNTDVDEFADYDIDDELDYYDTDIEFDDYDIDDDELDYHDTDIEFGKNDKIVLPNTQILSFEEQMYLRAHRRTLDPFDMNIIHPDEMLAAKCTHRDVRTGEIAYTVDSNGKCHCAICGATWEMLCVDTDSIQPIIENVTDMINSIKQIYTHHKNNPSFADRHEFLSYLDKISEDIRMHHAHAVSEFAKYPEHPANSSISDCQFDRNDPFANHEFNKE